MTIKEKEEKSKNVLIHYARRAIKHKDFRDITAAQADSELSTRLSSDHPQRAKSVFQRRKSIS